LTGHMVQVANLERFLGEYPPLVQQWVLAPYESRQRPIVIGGCGRSGTSLLRVMLDNHPNIACGPESSLFVPMLPSPTNAILVDGVKDIVPGWVHDLRWLYGFTDQQAEWCWFGSCCQAHFADRWLAVHTRTNQGKSRIAEKTPKNVQCLDWIWHHWPLARFIHVIRDGRDAVCSLRHHPRWKYDEDGVKLPTGIEYSIEQCTIRWVSDVSAGLRHATDPRYIGVKYEDLVQRPKTVLKRVLGLVGEPWDDAVLAPGKWDARRDPQAEGVDQPVFTSSIGRWRRDLSNVEIDLVKNQAGPLLKTLGYVSGDSWR